MTTGSIPILPTSLTSGTPCLLDTNILLRWGNRNDSQHTIARNAVRRLVQANIPLCLTAQNGIESWNVLTRPLNRNGYGYSTTQAAHALRLYLRVFSLLPDAATIFDTWQLLVTNFGVSGVQVHDARLVAVMQTHSVTHLLTFNFADFARYAPIGIVAIDPANV